MDERKTVRRERRRRKCETKMEGNEFKKTIENAEHSIKAQTSQSSGKIVRKDTYTVVHSKSDINMVRSDVKKNENSLDNSDESKNLTYSLNKESDNFTYNIDKAEDAEIRPVPAPRKWKSINLDTEKVSSDTDRDITEIDLDDMRVKSPKSDLSSKQSPISYKSELTDTKSTQSKDVILPPIPKPRKNVKKPASEPEKTKPELFKSSIESLNSNVENFHEKNMEISEKALKIPEVDSNELPSVSNLQNEVGKSKRNKYKSLFDRKERKKSKLSLLKLEKKKIPKIATILKDLKEEEEGEGETKPEMEINTDFQIDSPHYTESAENGWIYVQGKNGFHIMEKEEVLKSGNENIKKNENGGIMMEDSTVKTAVLFQKYWARSMTYFHGVLAGLGFSHAGTVMAIMLHFSYEPQSFLAVYSCLSLKIHCVFYMLTAFCIVSCFDRIDIGHMNRKHWHAAWKFSSMWIILIMYTISFILTFSNQNTEVRFDAFTNGNMTEIWDGFSPNQIQANVLQWYHTVWTRDILVLFAWLMISLTKFDDYLYFHIHNMGKYAQVKNEDVNLHQKTDFF